MTRLKQVVEACRTCKSLMIMRDPFAWPQNPCFLSRYYSSSAQDHSIGFISGGMKVDDFPLERIRNFAIIAHIDHGKSTIADRLMELTGAIRSGSNAQYLDNLQVERDRGITIKAQTASLVYKHAGQSFLLNLIDTPGHVDFHYEVSRSLAACQGALLVVDAGQGIQAQTIANHRLAASLNLTLIPVINKIDLPQAEPLRVQGQIENILEILDIAPLLTSAKTGRGIDTLLPAIIKHIPQPTGSPTSSPRLLLFDAYYDTYRGVICLVQVVDGQVSKGEKLSMASSGDTYEIQEIGLLTPEPFSTGKLMSGQVGYIICGIKKLSSVRVGDTMHLFQQPVIPLPGFIPAKPMVFSSLFPIDGEDFEALTRAIDRLKLNDNSVTITREHSEALGPGFRAGFLGMLHMEVFLERLANEHEALMVTTTPSVTYRISVQSLQNLDPDDEMELTRPSDYPLDRKVNRIEEPTVEATIIGPHHCLGKIMQLCQARRGDLTEQQVIGEGERFLLRYTLPLSALASDLYAEIKSRSSGYATFDYQLGEYRAADLVRLDILAHGEPVEALSRIVHKTEVDPVGRAILEKMKEMMDRQQFDIILQARSNGKIIARETIKAVRKDVTAKCYGGDVTRKRKLLDKQKEGKKKLKSLGSIEVPAALFPALMKTL